MVKNAYRNSKWHEFCKVVNRRDDNKCVKCGRGQQEVTLQTHHTLYRVGKKPWEYPTSDCITLCKGCHAQEHGIIQPKKGWILDSIEDLGGLNGNCERAGCGKQIRYNHITYHPSWGYLIVGSTCIDHLTIEDRYISRESLKQIESISEFLGKTDWKVGYTKRLKPFYFATFKHHQIRIYGKENNYTIQIALKNKGQNFFTFKDFIKTKNKNLDDAKELGFIIIKGILSQNETEKSILRDIYRRIR